MRSLTRCLCLISMVLLSACATSMVPMDLTLMAPPPTIPSANRVTLVVTPELKSLTESSLDQGVAKSTVGDAIIHYSDQMLRTISTDVQRIDGAQGSASGRFFVTPAMKRYESSHGTFTWEETIKTLVLEWRVTDISGKTIYLDTVVGEGRGTLGNAFVAADRNKEIVGRLLQDVFTKSRARLVPVLSAP
jgi:hypothetical protein